MDKSWLKSPKDSVEYREGVTRFILSSKKFARNPEMVICPCKVCRNLKPQTDDDLFIHLNKYGVDNEYTVWLAHGEQVSASTEVEDCDRSEHLDEDFEILELHQMYKDNYFPFTDVAGSSSVTNREDEYRKKVNEAEVPLYPGCTKYTKISATLDMYKLKATFGLSNAAFDEFLKKFKDMLPDANSFPESLYTIKKFLKEFDLGLRDKHKWFNGRKEKRRRPKMFTGHAVLCALRGFKNNFGKKKKPLKKFLKGDRSKVLKKKSIFFDLPYWEVLPLRHNLDVMHIEKNVCESVLATILDVKGKSKIGLESRRDMELLELMEEVPLEERNDNLQLPSAPYTFTKDEKLKFCRRWMYPFERYMKVLKDYVKNRAKPEGSIAENYLADECLRFCGRYMKQVAVVSNKRKRNERVEDETIVEGSTLSKGCLIQLSDSLHKAVHLCVLLNSEEVVPYIEVHKEELKCSDQRFIRDSNLLEKRHLQTFIQWLQAKITSEDSISALISDTLTLLVKGPRYSAMSHTGFVINGNRFHTIGANVSTQDYGVHIEADTLCRSSAKDRTQEIAPVKYYGVIRDILVLDFNHFRVAVFHCDWANLVSGVKKEDGFTVVNLHEGLSKKDPFILASHAKQVFYSRESETSSWYTVLRAPPRGFHELDMFDESVFTSHVGQDASAFDIDNEDTEEN
ncbi:hypothetical protein M0R45_001762 [Rubus argutus]|uniref:Transposase n=1 Tax=Rubus argutus TaxID=59490 RepID=A0AAW1VKK8_RUBAR